MCEFKGLRQPLKTSDRICRKGVGSINDQNQEPSFFSGSGTDQQYVSKLESAKNRSRRSRGVSSLRILNMFVACPEDVAAECQAVTRVVARLNRPGGPAETAGFLLRALRWEDLAPEMGRPEQVLLDRLPVEEWDLFLGILWSRFGTPTGGVDPETGLAFNSGTEEEFERARSSEMQTGKPRILFYRCTRPVWIDTTDTTRVKQLKTQLEHLEVFFERWKIDGRNPGLYRTYGEVDEFERMLEAHLEQVLGSMGESEEECQGEHCSTKTESGTPSSLRGTSRSVAFLDLEIASFGALVEKHRDPDKLSRLTLAFQSFVERVAEDYGGAVVSRTGKGATLIFWKEGFETQAVLAGLALLRELEGFNLDPGRNHLQEAIEIRAGASRESIEFQPTIDLLVTNHLSFLKQPVGRLAAPGEFCASAELLEQVGPRLASRFRIKGGFGEESVFSFRRTSNSELVTEEALDSMSEELRRSGARVHDLLRAFGAGEAVDRGSISSELDSFYAAIERLYDWFPCLESWWSVDPRWAQSYLEAVEKTATAAVAFEASVSEELRESLTKRADRCSVVRTIATRRSESVAGLKVLVALTKHQETHRRQDAALDLLRRLSKADELDREQMVIELMSSYRREFEQLVEERRLVALQVPIEALWNEADALLYHDEHRSCGPGRGLVEKLAKFGPEDRFHRLEGLLNLPLVTNAVRAEDFLCGEGARPNARRRDSQTLWRCLLSFHPALATRSLATSRLSLNSIWHLLGRQRLAPRAVYYLGQRLLSAELGDSVNLQKLFFDSTRAKVERWIGMAHSVSLVKRLEKIVGLYERFGILGETLYASRYLDLLRKLAGHAGALGYDSVQVKTAISRLEAKMGSGATRAGSLPWSNPKNRSEVPQRIQDLPPTTQRTLAGEAPYLEWFYRHSDFRIAEETLAHIHEGNALKVLRNQRISSRMLDALCGRQDLMCRPRLKQVAVMHSKCKVEFADPYLARLRSSASNRMILCRIAIAPSTRIEVARKALCYLRVQTREQARQLMRSPNRNRGVSYDTVRVDYQNLSSARKGF